jgi:hypothetical protein
VVPITFFPSTRLKKCGLFECDLLVVYLIIISSEVIEQDQGKNEEIIEFILNLMYFKTKLITSSARINRHDLFSLR